MNSSMAARARMKLLRGCMIGAALLSAAACTDRAAKERAQADSDLARDLALAGAQPANATPTFQDTTVAPAPAPASHATQGPPATVQTHVSHRPRTEMPRHVEVAQAPAPSPTPAPVTQAPITAAATPAALPATIGSGTGAGLTSGTKVCTSSLPGDKLVATMNEAITGSNGAVIPAGSSVVLEVASASPGGGDNGDNGQITFRVRSIQVNDKTYPVDATATPTSALEKVKVDNPDANADKKKVIGGAIVGGILGQIIGHNTKGTIIGAAAGAATGAVVAHASQKYDSCLPAGAAMHLTLNAPLVM